MGNRMDVGKRVITRTYETWGGQVTLIISDASYWKAEVLCAICDTTLRGVLRGWTPDDPATDDRQED